MWLTRAEFGVGAASFRPAFFYDIGWPGRRADFFRAGPPLAGGGVGLSVLDGLLRVDVARGVRPERQWRTDIRLDARF